MKWVRMNRQCLFCPLPVEDIGNSCGRMNRVGLQCWDFCLWFVWWYPLWAMKWLRKDLIHLLPPLVPPVFGVRSRYYSYFMIHPFWGINAKNHYNPICSVISSRFASLKRHQSITGMTGSGARTTRSINPCITWRELESRRWSKRQNVANLVYFLGISFLTHCLVFFDVSWSGLLNLLYFQNTAGYWKRSQTVRCWSVGGMSSLWVNLWVISCIFSYERGRCLMMSRRCGRISKFRTFFRGLQHCGYYEIGWDDRSEVLSK